MRRLSRVVQEGEFLLQPVFFFERVTAGSQAESAQLSAARGNPVTKKAPSKTETLAADERGRVIFSFLDDLHTSPASLARARQALLHFVDEQPYWFMRFNLSKKQHHIQTRINHRRGLR